MAAFDPATLDRWRALAIVDRDGTTVGTISEFYLDRETGYPTWALVNTGLFGATQTFVPLVQATEISDGLQVPYAKSHIKDAPRLDPHDELTPSDEATLFAHYGVAYEPLDQPEPSPVEGPGPVPTQPGPAETPGMDSAQGGSAQASASGADLGPAETPGAVAIQPESVETPGLVSTQPGSAEAPGPVPAQPPSVEAPGSSPAGPESSASVDVVDARSGSVPPEPTGTIPAEPGTDEASGARGSSALDAADGAVPDEPGTADPDAATRVDQQGLRAEGLEPDDLGAASPPGEAQAAADLSRTAPVEPGLPGSTAASPYGSPTTIDKGAEQPARPPEEVAWPPGPAGSFEEQVPLDRPAGSSDRWPETTQAAEPEPSARPASPPPEERSPLERARRRLERLVGVGQEHTDPEDVSPTDRDAAEGTRRNRLGLDEDDDRRR